MRPTFTLTFPVQPDLVATMDIQIPALAWQPADDGRWRRTYHLDGESIVVDVTQGDHALAFTFQARVRAAEQVRTLLAAAFPTMVATLSLDAHPALAAMRQRYQGVIVMAAAPFEALVLTVLSQNRTGEIVRAVYPRLAQACGGITAPRVAALGAERLAEVIRSAGPYKATRLAQTATTIDTLGEDTFDRLVRGPTPQALAFLESLPGVAHKTAACVLVFAAATTATLPVDTHLFRVVDRIGLACHHGHNSKTVREQLIDTLLRYGPDLAPAHFLFLLVGRSTCTATSPSCEACFVAPYCRHATPSPAAGNGRGTRRPQQSPQ